MYQSIIKTERKTKHLYNLNLNETIQVKEGVIATRVEDGWMYECHQVDHNSRYDPSNGNHNYWTTETLKAAFFVPYNTEFEAISCDFCGQKGVHPNKVTALGHNTIDCPECNGIGFTYKKRK